MTFPLISEAWAETWGLTLLHSIWQGAAWSVLLFIAFRFIRQSTSRYLAGILAMCGLLVTMIITLFVLMPSDAAPVQVFAGQPDLFFLFDEDAAGTSFLSSIQWLLPWFLNFWMLGTLLFIIRTIAGMHYMHRIEKYGNPEIPADWQAMIDRISDNLGIRRPLKVLDSMHVDMPMVYGYFKPVLFLPATYMSGLSAAQLEAVFAHELAHIRRHDFLVNLIQRMVEAVLFFNPFVWWISQNISNERERCCDDLAVEYCSDRRIYVRALSQLELYRSAHHGLAMGLASDRSDLLHRMRRLIEPDYREGGQYRLVILAVIITFFWFGFKMIDTSAKTGENPKEVVERSMLEATVLPSMNYQQKQAVADTLPPTDFIAPEEVRRIQKTIAEVRVPQLTEVHVPVIDTIQIGKQLELASDVIADIDIDQQVEVALQALEDVDIDVDTDFDMDMDVVMDAALKGLEQVKLRLDTNIVWKDTVSRQMDRERREAFRRAQEELRLMQRELREVNREELLRLREEMLEQREQMREEMQRVREQLRLEIEENEDLTPEERAKMQRELAEARREIAREFAQQQEQMHKMQQEEIQRAEQAMQEVQHEMQLAQREMQQVQRELLRAEADMERHGEFISRMEDQLREDSYLEPGESLKTLRVVKDEVRFNGRKVLEEDLGEYMEIYREFFGEPVKDGKYEYKK